MTWHTDPPKRQNEYLVVDAWSRYGVARYEPQYGWWIKGYWRRDGVLCWMDVNDLPAIPAHLMRERW